MGFPVPSDETLAGIQQAVQGGMTPWAINYAMHALIGHGIGVAPATGIMRRFIPDFKMDDWGDDWTRAYKTFKQHEALEKYPEDKGRLERWTIESPLPRPVEYRYLISYNTYDLDGNLTGEAFRYYYSNEKLSPEEAVSRFMDAFGEAEPHSMYLTGDFRFSLLEHNEGWGK